MEGATVLRSFHCAIGTSPYAQSVLKKPSIILIYNPTSNKPIQGLTLWGRLMSFPVDRKGSFMLNAKGSETTLAVTSDVSSKSSSEAKAEKKNLWMTKFPSGFESLVLEVCDETDVAELKVKVGDFQMHLKRNIGAVVAPPPPVPSPSTPPPVPGEPMDKSLSITLAAPPPKPSTAITSPFANVSPSKALKLAALDDSDKNAYAIISSPTVGSFRRGRTVKGKTFPPICKEGDMIREGQAIAYLDQFGNEVPIKSDVAGEVLKILYAEGEAVGYGDPLFAVLPSFHEIK